MKAIFAVLAVCLVACQAGVVVEQPPTTYEGLTNDLLKDMNDLAIQTAKTLEHQYEEIVLDPIQEVNTAVANIEELRVENEACVAAEDEAINAVLDTMHDELNSCGVVAAKESADIMVDISDATQQLVFGGYDVATSYQRCQKYKYQAMKQTCLAKWTIKATFYLANARRSIRTIKKSTNERIPAVFADADVCTHSASGRAVAALNEVEQNVSTCAKRI